MLPIISLEMFEIYRWIKKLTLLMMRTLSLISYLSLSSMAIFDEFAMRFSVLHPLVANVGNAESLARPRHVVLLVHVHVADGDREDRPKKFKKLNRKI